MIPMTPPVPAPPVDESPAGPVRARRRPRLDRPQVVTLGILAVVVAGIVARAVVLSGPLGRADADEVIAGLMARRLGADGFPAYFWGQHYGGTAELAPVALSLRLFGTSVLAMRVPTLVLGAVDAVLVWRCARRVMPERQARVAALLMWIWPPVALWFGVREQLFYVPTVTLGLLAVLLGLRTAHRTSSRPGGRRLPPVADWFGLGLVLGLGWWTSPDIAFYLVPAVAAVALRPASQPDASGAPVGGGSVPSRLARGAARDLASRLHRPPWPGLAAAVGGMVVGAAPWLATNVGSGMRSLRASDSFPVTGTYVDRLLSFFRSGLPGVVGARAPFDGSWLAGPVGVLLLVAIGAALVVGLGRSLRVGAWDGLGLVAYPFVFATIPFVLNDDNLRYVFFAVPFVCVTVARAAVTRRQAGVLLVVAALVTGGGLAQIRSVTRRIDPAVQAGNVGDLGPVLEVLDEVGIDAVYADYWVAYRLAFASDGRVVAAPTAGIDRFAPYDEQVRAASRSAWVVPLGSAQDRALQARLGRMGVAAEVRPAGEFAVVIPARPVRPDEVPEEGRRPVPDGSLPTGF